MTPAVSSTANVGGVAFPRTELHLAPGALALTAVIVACSGATATPETTGDTFFAPGVVDDLKELRADHPAFMLDRGPVLEEARQLPAEAGCSDGYEVTINVVNSNPVLSMADVVAAQVRWDSGTDVVLQPNDPATMYAGMRDGVADIDGVGAGIILRDQGDVIIQFYLQDVLPSPSNRQKDRVDELIKLQNRAIDSAQCQGHLEELAGILHRGRATGYPCSGIPTAGPSIAACRTTATRLPFSQLIKKWAHAWRAGGGSSDYDHNANSERGYRP